MTVLSQDALFRRGFRVTLQDKQFGSVGELRPLTFSFSVQRDKTFTPNNANILLYNLSADTRQELEQLSGGFGQGTAAAQKTHARSTTPTKKPRKPKAGVAQAPQDAGVTVRLEAGYGDHIGQIFLGVLRKVSSWRKGPDWLTQISGGDAEHSITTARISQTFPKGTTVASVVRALVKTMGVGDGNLANLLQQVNENGLLGAGTTLSKALTMHGDSATELEQLMRSCGMEWSIQDGSFCAGLAGTPTFPGAGPLLTPDTGLVDEPAIDKNGKIVGKALLNPDLLPGRVFRVESTRVTGSFLCEKTIHKGTSDSAEWYVEFVGAPPAKGSKAAALAQARHDTGFSQ